VQVAVQPDLVAVFPEQVDADVAGGASDQGQEPVVIAQPLC
jgi:hypothetical protein